MGDKPTLSRSLGGASAFFLVINTILGMSIFFTPQMIAAALPYPFLILAAWLAGGVIVLCGALCIAELGSRFPRAGGIYIYLREAFGNCAGFLFGWAAFAVTFTGSISLLAAAFALYLEELLGVSANVATFAGIRIGTGQIIAIALISVLSYINYRGVKLGGYFQNSLAALKIAAIVLFVIAGFLTGKGGVGNFEPFFPETFDHKILGGFLFALIPIYFAYTGWDATTYLGAELKSPRRAIPNSIMGGIFTIIAIYLMMNIVYIFAIPPGSIKEVQAIGAESAEILFGKTGGVFFTVLILLSIAGCVSSVILIAPRIYYAMAQNGLFFKKCAKVHPVHRTPHASIIFQAIWASLLVLTGTVEQLVVLVTVIILTIDILLMLAVFKIRERSPAPYSEEIYKTPLYPFTPAIFIAATAAILVNTIIEKPHESIAGTAIFLSGIPLYLFLRTRESCHNNVDTN